MSTTPLPTANRLKPSSPSVGWLDALLPFGPRQGMGNFDVKDVRCDEFVKRVLEMDADAVGFRGVSFGDRPFESHAGIQAVFHSASRSSRMAGTPMSRTPCF